LPEVTGSLNATFAVPVPCLWIRYVYTPLVPGDYTPAGDRDGYAILQPFTLPHSLRLTAHICLCHYPGRVLQVYTAPHTHRTRVAHGLHTAAPVALHFGLRFTISRYYRLHTQLAHYALFAVCRTVLRGCSRTIRSTPVAFTDLWTVLLVCGFSLISALGPPHRFACLHFTAYLSLHHATVTRYSTPRSAVHTRWRFVPLRTIRIHLHLPHVWVHYASHTAHILPILDPRFTHSTFYARSVCSHLPPRMLVGRTTFCVYLLRFTPFWLLRFVAIPLLRLTHRFPLWDPFTAPFILPGCSLHTHAPHTRSGLPSGYHTHTTRYAFPITGLASSRTFETFEPFCAPWLPFYSLIWTGHLRFVHGSWLFPHTVSSTMDPSALPPPARRFVPLGHTLRTFTPLAFPLPHFCIAGSPLHPPGPVTFHGSYYSSAATVVGRFCTLRFVCLLPYVHFGISPHIYSHSYWTWFTHVLLGSFAVRDRPHRLDVGWTIYTLDRTFLGLPLHAHGCIPLRFTTGLRTFIVPAVPLGYICLHISSIPGYSIRCSPHYIAGRWINIYRFLDTFTLPLCLDLPFYRFGLPVYYTIVHPLRTFDSGSFVYVWFSRHTVVFTRYT